MTRVPRGSIFVIATAGCVLVGGAIAGRGAKLYGVVVDPNGAVIGKAHVVVRSDRTGQAEPAGRSDHTLTSDARTGQFVLSVPAGVYDVCVMADAFMPDCRKVQVNDERATMQRFQLETVGQ